MQGFCAKGVPCLLMNEGDAFLGFGAGRPVITVRAIAPAIPLAGLRAGSEPPVGRAQARKLAQIDSPRAWLIVVATFVSTLTAFFITYSFTTFFGAMREEFGAGSASTSMMFALTIFFLFVLGLPAGKASDRWGPRPVVLVGATVLIAGLLLTSRVNRLEVGFVTYGLGVGFGVACVYVPVVSQVTGWFERRRAAALGIAVSGIGVGTMLGPRVSQALIDDMGWRSAYRVLAMVAAVGFCITALLIRPAPTAAGAEPLNLRGLVRSPIFRSVYLAGLLMSLGLFVPFLYLKPYAESVGISPVDAALLLSVLGLGSIGGRVILGTFAGRMGVMRLYQACFVVLAASFLLWLGADDRYWMLATFAFILGVAYGGYVALSPAAAAELFGLAGLGSTLGAIYTAGGVGSLAGLPVAGFLQDTTGSYTTSIIGAMVVAVLGAAVLRRAITLAN